jgi:hypothetical protein
MKTYTRSWFVVIVLAVTVLGVIALWPRPARAAGPWYVAPGGSDSNSCVSAGSSCATINGAIGKASSGDTIYVATGTYTSSTGDEVVPIDKSITLSGGWNSEFTAQSGMSTIDGQGARRSVTVSSGVTASIERFVVQYGLSTDSLAGGGGINNSGTLTVTNSTITSNTAFIFGGGISNSGTMTLNNSAVTANKVRDGVGGGGGLYNFGGSLTLNNSTVSSNSVGAGGEGGGILSFLSSGTLILNNSTVTGNIIDYGQGGGLRSSSPVTLRNTLVAGNTSPTGSDCSGTFTSAGYNVIGNTAGCTFSAAIGDLLNVNAQLWPNLLGSPGYHPLLPGSPAIDAGNPDGCTDNLGNPLNTDQRGVARVGRCDIGAYEFDPNNNPIKQIFLPMIRRACSIGICGHVTLNGAPAAGASLELRFFNGSSWSTLATTTTNANGDYSFLGMPGLGPGQRYYVRYRNTGGVPGRLWFWGTRTLTSYAAGSDVEIGNFDIADIPLVSPPAGATVALPYTFQWVRRPATPSDTYELDLYDPTDGDPYAYTNLLGYVNGVTITGLPSGFSPGALYVWEIWVYSPDGGFGISYESRAVTFSNTGASAVVTSQSAQLKPAPVREDIPKR